MSERDNEIMLKRLAASSLCAWWPRIQGLLIPMPATKIVELTPEAQHEVLGWMEEGVPESSPIIDEVRATATAMGYPLFLRTDLASAKHDFASASYVGTENELLPHMMRVIEVNYEAGLPWKAVVLRQFIPLASRFKGFDRLPIAPERRYFINDGEVLCWHPYWPEDAIQFPGRTPPKTWKELLEEMNTPDDDEVETLTEYAEEVGSVYKGFWSVDFAQAKGGRWYFIDMAQGDVSWHPKDCPYNPQFIAPRAKEE